ncbi:glycogen synthase GlgA [Sphingomonas sp.]|uniref:glycogen synthase GlgA n=1 Tax=Sphingomonas sp. TaxID=28214 RepID=UPI0035C85D1A
MNVLSVASEAFPLVKTGGLADVVGALPGALSPHGVAVTTLVPGYPQLAEAVRGRVLAKWDDLLGVQARLLGGEIAGHALLVLDAPELFARAGGPYADADGRDWDDNWRRFAALGRAAADIAGGKVGGHGYDIVHAHDWQAAMAPAYLRYDREAGTTVAKSLVTIHNIAFQGWFDAGVFPYLALPGHAFALDGVEYYGGVGLLKAGLVSADAITTVSPTYAQEIRTPAFGMGLEGLIAGRAADVHGIANGIDPEVWNSETDAALPARYDAKTLAKRAANKRAVEKMFGLETGDGPIFTVISRLTWQKGMDVLAMGLDDLVAMGGRLALLGSGDHALEQAFLAAADRHPGRIGVRIGYDEPLSHLLQGGADAILIPSRFEPCGLTQLYGLAYGCVPVVARTGGLADTVIDANLAAAAAGVATGVQFADLSPDGLRHALRRTMALWENRDGWAAMQRQGMRADFSWGESGRRYAELYRSLLQG